MHLGRFVCMSVRTRISKSIAPIDLIFLLKNYYPCGSVFQARLPCQEMVKLNKGIIFIITETQFAIQSQVM